jgi:acetyl-CoA carboxylase biotin carboxyl carrier protein
VARLLHETDLSEIEVETVSPARSADSDEAAPQGRVHLQLRRGTAPVAPRRAPAAAAPALVAASVVPENAGLLEVSSLSVGVFHLGTVNAKDRGAALLQPGDTVAKGQVLGVVESLKIPNEVRAERAGRVAEVLAENGQGVEFGQVLLILEPQD